MAEKNERVILTGAGRGMGKAIALELAGAGHKLVLASRTEQQITEVAAEITSSGGTAVAVPTDVADQASVEALIQRAIEEYGGVDAIVNNAGRFNTIGPTWEVDPENFWKDITVNLRGPFLMCRTVIPRMIEQGHGTIINMIGGGSGGAIPNGNGYGTSKAGLTRFTETLSVELKEHGISVFATNPGLVRTEMTELQLYSEAGKKWMKGIEKAFRDGVDRPPTDAARLIRRLLADDYFVFTGRMFGPDDNPEEIKPDADRILEEDLRMLRFRM